MTLPRFLGQKRCGIMAVEKMSKAAKRTRQNYTPEYRAQVVRMCTEAGKSATDVARDLGISVSAVFSWVKQAKSQTQSGSQGNLTTSERDELTQLRREVRTLRKECEILPCATALFAKRSMS